ncbi:MAG: hypothetical protein ABL883_06715 [Terricaulis sp.]
MSEVSFEATRTRTDVLKALIANTWRSPAALLWYIGGSLLVAGIAFAVNDEQTVVTRMVVFAAAFGAMVAFYSLLFFVCLLFAARKSWTAPGGLEPIKFNLSATGLSAATATAQGQSGWDNWKAAFETNSLIVIRHHLGLLQIIPKRNLDAMTVGRIREVLRAHIKGGVRLAAHGKIG